MNRLSSYALILPAVLALSAVPGYAIPTSPGPPVQAVAKGGYTLTQCNQTTLYVAAGTPVFFSAAGSSDQDYYGDPMTINDEINASVWEYRKEGDDAWTPFSSGLTVSRSFAVGKWYVRAIVDDKHTKYLTSDDVNNNPPEGYPGSYASGQVEVYSVSVDLKAVTFTSDHGIMTNWTTNFADSGGQPYDVRGWRASPASNNPVSHTQGLPVSLNVVLCVKPAGFAYTLIGTSSNAALNFSTSAGSAGADQTVGVTGSTALPAKVDIIDSSIAWKIDITPRPGLSIDAGASGSHKIFVTWGTPTGGPTVRRVERACTAAMDATGTSDAADKSNSYFASNPGATPNPLNYENAWALLDHPDQHGDCITLAELCSQSLGIVGIGASTGYAYPTTDGTQEGLPFTPVNASTCSAPVKAYKRYTDPDRNISAMVPCQLFYTALGMNHYYEAYFTITDESNALSAYTVWPIGGPFASQDYYRLQVLRHGCSGGYQYWGFEQAMEIDGYYFGAGDDARQPTFQPPPVPGS